MNEIALANFYRVLNDVDRFPKEHELAEAAIAAKDELNALRSAPTKVSGAEAAELQLARQWLWVNHGCDFAALYGDDGEMSCGNCHIDCKRMSIKEITDYIQRLRSERKHPSAEMPDLSVLDALADKWSARWQRPRNVKCADELRAALSSIRKQVKS